MGDATLSRAEAVFDEALSVPMPERASFLDQRCAGDAPLRELVASLLEHASVAGGFLERPPELPADLAETDDLIGSRLGAYEIEAEIASGGMGRVYRARRTGDDFEQRVAIKVIRPGLVLPGAEERFRAERRLLAALDHPRIARLLDGGATEDGRPYLVMDLVDGVPLDQACAGLATEARLELFEKIGEAVAYAHARLVVHRDLKPGNILVAAGGEPRLLDFGVAKVLGPDAGEPTGAGERPLTPQYASPEQVRGEPVTVATDVYALGLLLYEMLTGRRPYDVRSTPGAETRRVICETTPAPPSAAAADAAVRQRLRGDLDRIVLKAIAKDPADRYGSVVQLLDDIGRWRRREPVLAGPGTAGYRLRKGLERHRAAAGAGGVALLAVVGALVLVTAAYVDQREARAGERALRETAERAERDALSQQRVADQIGAFLDDMLGSIHPNEARGRDTALLRAVLDRAAGRLAQARGMDPAVAAPLELRVGASYVAIGELDAGTDHLLRAIELAGEGPGLEIAGEAWHWLGQAAFVGGQQGEGLSRAERGLALRRSALPPDHPEIAQSLSLLAAIQIELGDYEGAAAAIEEALPIWRRHQGSRSEHVLNDSAKLGAILIERGRYDRAAELLDGVVGSLDDTARVSPVAAAVLNMRAVAARRAGRLDEADRFSSEAIDAASKVFGPEDPNTLTLRGNRAVLLEALGRPHDAEAEHLAVLEIQERTLGGAHPAAITTRTNLIKLRSTLGRHDDAVATARDAVSRAEGSVGPTHPLTLVARGSLGAALMRSGLPGSLEEAQRVMHDAYVLMVETQGPDSPMAVRARADLAELYAPDRLNDPEQHARWSRGGGSAELDPNAAP